VSSKKQRFAKEVQNNMRNSNSILKALTILVLMVAVYAHAGAQTATGVEKVTKGSRVVTRVLTVVGANGNVLQSTDGHNWGSIETAAQANVASGLQSELAKRQAVAQVTATGVTASPNPTMGTTTVSYQMARPGEVLLTVHDIRGAEVLRQVLGSRDAGVNSSAFNASELSNGIYYYQIIIDGMTAGGGKVVVAH
jgi:hypothetical protein